jgi:hypothetical protein
MSEQPIPLQVTINLNGLRGKLNNALQKTILLVSGCLQNINEVNPEALELPVSIKIELNPNMEWNRQTAVANCSEWVLANGFRDAIEAVSGCLEEANQVLSFWQLVKDSPEKQVKISDWNEKIVGNNKRFHRLGLPDKLDHLRDAHGINLNDKISSHLLSANVARNCLVHREGIVTERDINKEDNTLEVSWRKIFVFLEQREERTPLYSGQYIEEGTSISINFEDDRKNFNLGERIVLSPQEFIDCCWSLSLFGEELIKQVNTWGIENGFIKPAPAS